MSPKKDNENPVVQGPGYHLTAIVKGTFGDADKIREETLEFIDARQQGLAIMELIELSDLYGAIQGFLGKHYPMISMADLERMSAVTQRAFCNGYRG